jgi:hypothetical protein
MPAAADVVIQTPGFSVEQGRDVPYWRQRQEDNWRARRDFREEQYQRQAWQRDHCVRDWGGQEFCRR